MLAKSVSKLLVAASMSKARLIVVTWYFMFAFGLLDVRLQEWPGEGPLFESESNKHFLPKWGHYSNRTQTNTGGQKEATIRLTSWAIIDVRHATLGQIWDPPQNHK